MRIAVTGAGVGGLTAAIFLARADHDVVVLERDGAPADEGWGDRRGAPQVNHSHAFLARLRNLLRDELPDVLADLLDAGVTEVPWRETTPPTLDDYSPRAGDEDLVVLASRRTTFERVLRAAAVRTQRVELRDRCAVTGLIAEGAAGMPPRVRGVVTDGGTTHADLVVDASGRRSALPAMLAPHGARVEEEQSDTGIVYFSRFYRLLDGATEPTELPLTTGDLGYLKYAVFRGDNRTFSITLATLSADADLRRIRAAAEYDAVLRMLPAVEPWIDPARTEPISDVHLMAGLINRRRYFVAGGRPVALGAVALGDASVCTNPLYGRGCSLAAVHAHLLTGALADAGADLEALALAFDAATERELVPWYRSSVMQDESSKNVRWAEPAPREEPAGDEGAFLRSILTEGLLPLARVDAGIHRAFMRAMNLLVLPEAMMADPAVIGPVLAYWNDRHNRPAEPAMGPGRAELLAALG